MLRNAAFRSENAKALRSPQGIAAAVMAEVTRRPGNGARQRGAGGRGQMGEPGNGCEDATLSDALRTSWLANCVSLSESSWAHHANCGHGVLI
jgi:hypothetical protein